MLPTRASALLVLRGVLVSPPLYHRLFSSCATVSQAKVQGLATQVQQLQQEVHSMELEKKNSAAQVQALSEYVSRTRRPEQSKQQQQQRDTADKQRAGLQVKVMCCCEALWVYEASRFHPSSALVRACPPQQ